MKVAALEFRVADRFFAIEMKKVKQFFEVERKNLKPVPFLPDYVLGIVRYNNYVYPLISLHRAWELEGEESDTAVAIVYGDKEYAILIDEIVKIDELEKKENFLFEVFEENGKLIGNLNLDFLENVNIPTFKNKIIKEKNTFNENKKSFLLFECGNEILGVETALIKKVEDLVQGDTFILNGMIVKVVGFDKIYKECENKNLLILEESKTLGFKIGNILDIVVVDDDEVFESSEGIFNRYLIYKNSEAKIISNAYLHKIINKYGIHLKKEEEKKYDELMEVLIVDICGEKFALRMQNVLDIAEYDEAGLHFATDNPHVKGIVTTREGATYIISLEKVLNKKMDENEDMKIIVLKDKHHLKALLVSNIEDIVYVREEDILLSPNSETIIGGMVLLKDKMIPLFNILWPKDL